jgi:hypothetical protein
LSWRCCREPAWRERPWPTGTALLSSCYFVLFCIFFCFYIYLLHYVLLFFCVLLLACLSDWTQAERAMLQGTSLEGKALADRSCCTVTRGTCHTRFEVMIGLVGVERPGSIGQLLSDRGSCANAACHDHTSPKYAAHISMSHLTFSNCAACRCCKSWL